VAQDATDRHKTPQNVYSYEMHMCYRMFHTLMYQLKPMNERKIQQKYKIQTAKMHNLVIRRKTSQTAARRRKTPSCSMSTEWVTSTNTALSMPSMDNEAVTIIPGHCYVVVLT